MASSDHSNDHGTGSFPADPMHQFEIKRLLDINIAGYDISFTNSEDLHKTIVAEINDTMSIFMTAAVSDFTINKSDGKISRNSGKINLELIPNNDVIASIKSNYPNILLP
mgnify:CR=1 FL=1